MLTIKGGVDGDGGTGEVGGGVGWVDGGVGSIDGVSGMIEGDVLGTVGGGATMPGDCPGKPIKTRKTISAKAPAATGAQTNGLVHNFRGFWTFIV